MQRDSGTYCDEPEDLEDFAKFKEDFNVADRTSDIDVLIKGNAFMGELQSRIVPLIVDHEVFWSRYFYRLSKLQEKHKQRQALAQRAQQPVQEEVDLGWGDEDEDPADDSPIPHIGPVEKTSQQQLLQTEEDSPVGGEASQAAEEGSPPAPLDAAGNEKSTIQDAGLSSGAPAQIIASASPASPGKILLASPSTAVDTPTKLVEEETVSISSSVVQGSHKSDGGDLSPSSGSASGDWCVLQKPSKPSVAATSDTDAAAATETTEPPEPELADTQEEQGAALKPVSATQVSSPEVQSSTAGGGDEEDEEDAFLATVGPVGSKDGDDEDVDEDWGSWA